MESADRPGGARSGDREFFDWLHGKHRSVAADFGTSAGRTVLKTLGAADIVIEASRPGALAALGLGLDMIPHLDGQVWLSITGYGRAVADRVAFGDDAAVVGGILTDLAGWRWVLFVNAPIGITPPAGAAWAVPESRIASAPHRLDVPGALSVTAGLILVVYVVVSTHIHP